MKEKQSDRQRDKAEVLWEWYKEKEKNEDLFHCSRPTDYECLGLQHKSVLLHSNASVFISFVVISYQTGMRMQEMNRGWQRRWSDGWTRFSCFSGEKWRNFALESKQKNDNCSRLKQILLSSTKTCCSALADYCSSKVCEGKTFRWKPASRRCRGTLAEEAASSLVMKGLVMRYLMQNASKTIKSKGHFLFFNVV